MCVTLDIALYLVYIFYVNYFIIKIKNYNKKFEKFKVMLLKEIVVLVGSENPVKIEATKEAFEKYFENVRVMGIKVNSGVPDQPVNHQTFEGARNRALRLMEISKKQGIDADFFVGIEGGIIQLLSKWFAFGGMCIIDKHGKLGYGTSPLFELPDKVTEHLLNGVELGHVMDKLTGEENTKQKQGAVGIFTKGIMDRKSFYVNGLVVALIPFLNDELYFE